MCSAFLRLLKKDGWYVYRISGSHFILKHPSKKGIMVFPNHGSRELGKGLDHKFRKDAKL
jgi:predicted RNA binding protein YcfA (HicA-like mRNA interferase family)